MLLCAFQRATRLLNIPAMHHLLLLALLLLAGCAARHASEDSSSREGDAAFTRIADRFIEGYLAWRPQTGVALGLHEYDGRITDYSAASINAELARLKQFDQQLERLNGRPFTGPVRHDYRILQTAIRKELFNFEELQVYSQNPMTYAGALDVSIYIKRDFAPLEQRVSSIISVLNQTPNLIAAARANLAPALARPFVETAIQVANGLADFLGKELAEAVRPIRNEALWSEFEVANQRAIAELRGYAHWLKSEKLPGAHEHYALGPRRYREMLRRGELISLSPEQILKLGLEELRHEQQVFAETAGQIDPSRKPIDVFKAIQTEHPTEDSLIPDTKKNLEAIRQFVVDQRIVTIPSAERARVEETPAFLRATSFASMDTPGPFETKATEAYYYVTPVEKAWTAQQKEEWLTAFNYYTTDVVSIHEAYPGHYTQFLCLNASPASRLAKMFTSYAFVEGWAHYTEQLLLDEGFGAPIGRPATDAERLKALKYRLAQSDEALLRLCRLCVSVKMHCFGMTVDEATRFFQDHCYYEEKPARQEASRGTYDPEYLYYTLGKLQILKLREDWRKQEGAAFSLQRFHDELLRRGAPPIRLLREVMLKDPSLWNEVF
jgi:uncharacterized protein (DUF885 family)